MLDNRQRYLTLFQISQCSWCRKFYGNEPFPCPYNTLQSNCFSFDQVSEIPGWYSREKEIKKYEPRIIGMIQHVEEKEILAKCREAKCGAFNPNPQKLTCWKCERDTLRCPEHPELILRYNVEGDYWKCPLASHPQKYHEIREKIEPTITDTECPKCKPDKSSEKRPVLYYDATSFLLKCNRCNRLFTYVKGNLKEVKVKKK